MATMVRAVPGLPGPGRMVAADGSSAASTAHSRRSADWLASLMRSNSSGAKHSASMASDRRISSSSTRQTFSRTSADALASAGKAPRHRSSRAATVG